MMSSSVLGVAIVVLTLGAFTHEADAQDTSVSSSYSQQSGTYGQYRPSGQTSYSQVPSTSSSTACTDHLQKCSYWASTGECNSNPAYMHAYCRLSCGDCNGGSNGYGQPITPVAVSYNAVSPVSSAYGRGSGTYLGGLTGSYGYGSSAYTSNGYGINGFGNNGHIGNGYGSNGYGSNGYGTSGFVSNGYGSNGFGNNGLGSSGYGSNGYGSSAFGSNGLGSNGYGSGQPLNSFCNDLHAGCANWAVNGHCTINPSYMLQYCRLSCGSCGGSQTLPTYPQQPYLGQGGYGSNYVQPAPLPSYGGIQQPISNGYIQPQSGSYGQTSSSGYGQTSSYGQTSNYVQPDSTYSQPDTTGTSGYVSEARPSGYNSLGTSYVTPASTIGDYNSKKEKKLVAAKKK